MIFNVFRAQSCLIALVAFGAQSCSSFTNVCEECNNFQDSRQMFMVSDFKVSQKSFWGSWILEYCQFKNYFAFIAKKKLYFSLTCSFSCCLGKRGQP